MTIAYTLSIHNDDSYMLGPETYFPLKPKGFHHWRFGTDGVPHPATCAACGRKTDPTYINPHFRVKKRKRDLTMTYDGYALVSTRFRDFCELHSWTGAVFVPLPADKNFFVFRLSDVLTFDSERRETRFGKRCSVCDAHYEVTGAYPAYLRGIKEPIKEGFFRSDLEFAAGPEQSPIIILGIDTAMTIKAQKFKLCDLEAVPA